MLIPRDLDRIALLRIAVDLDEPITQIEALTLRRANARALEELGGVAGLAAG